MFKEAGSPTAIHSCSGTDELMGNKARKTQSDSMFRRNLLGRWGRKRGAPVVSTNMLPRRGRRRRAPVVLQTCCPAGAGGRGAGWFSSERVLGMPDRGGYGEPPVQGFSFVPGGAISAMDDDKHAGRLRQGRPLSGTRE
jgi:hypothetical protein